MIDKSAGPLILVRHIPTGNKIPIEWFRASGQSSRECIAQAVAAMDSFIEKGIWPDGHENERLEQVKPLQELVGCPALRLLFDHQIWRRFSLPGLSSTGEDRRTAVHVHVGGSTACMAAFPREHLRRRLPALLADVPRS